MVHRSQQPAIMGTFYYRLLLVTWCAGECLSYTRVHPSSVEFSPEATSPQSVEFGPPTTTQVRFPMEMEKATRRRRRRHRERERSQWSSWSTKHSREEGRKRPRDSRPSRTPNSVEFDKDSMSRRPTRYWPHADRAIVVFPCQEAAMKCEFVKEDTEHPYHCTWTTLEDPRSVEF